jgi:hypothetical protein
MYELKNVVTNGQTKLRRGLRKNATEYNQIK